ncbi:SurA N-terminal domain-containing protein [Dechloromonas denitrificans]|uniref:SurA N-terminal domain-containing protein n=1 Tax=Dechloromonas denitrificans TaxID=281362 RepID=UPI001CF89BBD|nr:SurA N-terminal domain-containing protein [Dechloromonas denitrificans]UCV10265.1 SurA N-terminal domain-containing protein [Dechloromonas denitrificans]
MFDAVRNNKKIVQIFLALITLPFAFFGVESYVRSVGAGDDVAKVGDSAITQQHFQQALRDQQERLRAQMGGQVDPKMLDNPQARKAIIDDLVDQRLLMLEANKKRMFVSDEAIRRTVGGIDAFKVDGKFSSERYEAVLRGQGMTPASFEAQLRQDLTLQQLAGAVAQSGVRPHSLTDRILALQTEKREVMEYRFALDAYLSKVKLSDDAVKKFYDENARQFQMPEQAKAEFVVLSMDTIGSQLAVTDAEIKAWYDGHKDRFLQAEERRASHILLASDKHGKDKAKTKAEELLKEIQKTPAAFADLAKKNSDDPGSASKGGDLGFFGRGMMVKPFEDAAFSQKEGDISGVVESDFGFHIIKVTGIHAAKEKPLAEVRAEIEGELKKTAASRKFAEAAEAFSNMVYEQSDSLKPVAEKFKLSIKQSDWIGRQANPANGPLGNEKLLAALFSDDSVKNKRNTETVETAANTLVAARIVDYKPSALQPFDSVKGNIESLLKRQEAQTLARKDGEERLEALKKGEDKLSWGAAKSVSRMDARLVPPVAAPAIFKIDTSKLPAYTGVDLPGVGYALYKLTKLDAGDKLDEARKQALVRQLDNLHSQEDVQVFLAALRTRYKVEINQSVLEAKEK